MTDEPREELHEYQAGSFTVEWRPGRCMHSGVCARGLPKVFDPHRRPWIVLSESDSETIAAQVDQCPSGALSWLRRS